MHDKVLVCYLFTKFDRVESILKFKKHYKKYRSGSKHSLLICFKLLNQKKILLLKNKLKNLNYIEFIDPENINDFDFGSYKRISKKYPNHSILFLNSHSYPLDDNWLKKLLLHFKKKTIIATSASYESLLTSLKIKRFYKIFSYLNKFTHYKKKFKPFPNPHIRTSSFLIKGSDFISFVKDKKFLNKEDTWYAESGFDSLTNFFKKKKYKIYVINSDGQKFKEKFWKNSETYNYLKQSKSIISDKHSRKYSKLSSSYKEISRNIVWGKF